MEAKMFEMESLLLETLKANEALFREMSESKETNDNLESNVTQIVSKRLKRAKNFQKSVFTKVNQIHNQQRQINRFKNKKKRKNKKNVGKRQIANDVKQLNQMMENWSENRKAETLFKLGKDNATLKMKTDEKAGEEIGQSIRLQMKNFANSKYRVKSDKLNQLEADISDEKWYELRRNEIYDQKLSQASGRTEKLRVGASDKPKVCFFLYFFLPGVSCWVLIACFFVYLANDVINKINRYL